MNEQEYKARRSHLRSINVMTADCDPADELAALEDRFVDQIVEEKMEDLYTDPEQIQEYFLEGSYDNTTMMTFFAWFATFLDDPTNIRSEQTRVAAKTFLEEAVRQEAQDHVASL